MAAKHRCEKDAPLILLQLRTERDGESGKGKKEESLFRSTDEDRSRKSLPPLSLGE